MADTPTLINTDVEQNLLLKMKIYIFRPFEERMEFTIFTHKDYSNEWKRRIKNSKVYTTSLVPIPSEYQNHLLDQFIGDMSNYMKVYFEERKRNPEIFFFDTAPLKGKEKPELHVIMQEKKNALSLDTKHHVYLCFSEKEELFQPPTRIDSLSSTPSLSNVQFSLSQSSSVSSRSPTYTSLPLSSSISSQTMSSSVKYSDLESLPTSSSQSSPSSGMYRNFGCIVDDVSYPLESPTVDDRTTTTKELPSKKLAELTEKCSSSTSSVQFSFPQSSDVSSQSPAYTSLPLSSSISSQTMSSSVKYSDLESPPTSSSQSGPSSGMYMNYGHIDDVYFPLEPPAADDCSTTTEELPSKEPAESTEKCSSSSSVQFSFPQSSDVSSQSPAYTSFISSSSISSQTMSSSVKYSDLESPPTSSSQSGPSSGMYMNYGHIDDVYFPLEPPAADDCSTTTEELPSDKLAESTERSSSSTPSSMQFSLLQNSTVSSSQSTSSSAKYSDLKSPPTSSFQSGPSSEMYMNYGHIDNVSFPLEPPAADDRSTTTEEFAIHDQTSVSEELSTDSREDKTYSTTEWLLEGDQTDDDNPSTSEDLLVE